MSRDFGRWFRFYDAVLDDPKVQRLPDQLFRAWVNLLCLANRTGGEIPADIPHIAFSLRMSETKATETLRALETASLIDVSETAYEPHNWNERQYKSDVSTTRVKRFRERKKGVSGNDDETHMKRDETVSETVPEQSRTETESETDQSRSERETRARRAKPSKTAKAVRWPKDAVVTDDWIKKAGIARKKHGLPEIDLQLEATQFANYWAAKSGGTAAKLDWEKTWINWALRAFSNGKSNGNGHARGVGGTLADFADESRAAKAEHDRIRGQGAGGTDDGHLGRLALDLKGSS